MPTKEDVNKLIQETLKSVKSRLQENKGNNKAFWSDDDFDEGLQSRCEGLEIFLIPHLDKPGLFLQYFSADELRKEIEAIYEVVNQRGFIAEPYLLEEFEKNKVAPPEFIDVVSYVLTVTIHSRWILAELEELPKEIDQKITYIINRCLSWLIETHIPGEGWSGLAMKTVSHVYATWSAVLCLPEIEAFEAMAADETKGKIKKFKAALYDDTQKWLIKFGKEQGKTWESDTSQFASSSIIFSVYGLESLLVLRVQRQEPELVKDLITRIITWWDERTRQYLSKTEHSFFASEATKGAVKIDYSDESVLVISLLTLAEACIHFKQELSEARYSATETVYQRIHSVMEDMYEKLSERFFDKSKGLWTTDTKDQAFSIYVTERAIEALLAYKVLLVPAPLPPEKIVEQLHEAVDGLISSVEKLRNEIGTMENRICSRIEKTLTELWVKKAGRTEEDMRNFAKKVLGKPSSHEEGQK